MRTSTVRRLLGTPIGLVLVATMVVACGDSAPDNAHPAAEATHETTYFAQYGVGTHAYKPRRLNPSVDGSLYVRRVHWTEWNNRRAVGDGIAYVNDCTPSCADGHYTSYRVTVRLAQPRDLCGSRFFTTIRLRGSGYHTYGHRSGVACRGGSGPGPSTYGPRPASQQKGFLAGGPRVIQHGRPVAGAERLRTEHLRA